MAQAKRIAQAFNVTPQSVDYAVTKNHIVKRGAELTAGAVATWAEMKDLNATFEYRKATVGEFINSIQAGHPFAHVFEKRRVKANFRIAYYLALDFDTCDERSTLAELFKNDMAHYYAYFGYTSPSHTPEKPKARLVFILDEPITDAQRYEQLYKAMLAEFPAADPAPKDVLRFFYGNQNCEMEIRHNTLPSDVVEAMVAHIERTEQNKERPKVIYTRTQPYNVRHRITGICKYMASAQEGERHRSMMWAGIKLGQMVASPLIDLTKDEAVQILVSAAPADWVDLERRFETFVDYGIDQGGDDNAYAFDVNQLGNRLKMEIKK